MITLTKTAAERIHSQIEKNNALALRFAAKESGCSGYSYVLDFAETQAADDLVFVQHGVKVFVDEKSHKILDGTQIDYVTEGLNQSFRFSNPRATDECGCGESFAVQP